MSPSSKRNRKTPYVVALTGGIASGKTMVSDEFASLGVPVIDMDIIAHQIVEPGQPALEVIAEVFGPSIIGPDGRLKRSELRAKIFSDPESRLKLEAILHPVIRQKAMEAVQKLTASYCILVIPLLSDRAVYPSIDRILVVDVDEQTQIERLMVRDGADCQQAKKVLASQINRQQRLEMADDVLDNSGSASRISEKVRLLHEKYTKLSRN